VCGGEQTLADVSDEDYFDACVHTAGGARGAARGTQRATGTLRGWEGP